MLIVQKFGGTSLADSQKLRNAALRTARLLEQGHQVVTVVSAQGHTTDRLIREAEQMGNILWLPVDEKNKLRQLHEHTVLAVVDTLVQESK